MFTMPILLRALCALHLLLACTAPAAPLPINLKPHCNFTLTNSPIGTGSLNGANNLASMPAGPQTFAAIPFQISGIIQLTSRQAAIAGRKFPDKVAGIKVGMACHRIHLLHGAGWNDVENTTIANLILHYADGDKREIAIIYGKHVFDWWENEDKPSDKDTLVAWTGLNRVSKIFATDLRIYKTTFANPKPGALITTIDYASTKKESAPFLLGLTIE